MATPEPTKAQADALALIAGGDVYRWEHSDSWWIIAPDNMQIPKATAASLVKRGWAAYSALLGVKRPLTITDAGRAHLPDASSTEK
ncbi:hypothetical protein ACIQVK_19360 [Streptomyces sp. NPDC090493]|uniref:hypothetical protein n=1 Tax=Streptomyces sp. NPDC090493 TaxID=3365964 RepID=UPI0037FD798A